MLFPLLQLWAAIDADDPSFKILQLTDLHYGEGDWQDASNAEFTRQLLAWENPDLVVITGDLVSGYAWDGYDGWYEELYQIATTPLLEAGVPWALALGNHDLEADLSAEQILSLFPQSLNTYGPSFLNHGGNSYIPVFWKGELEFVIWVVNTGNRHHCEGMHGWDCLHPDQVEWMATTQQALQIGAKPAPGMVFMHIPPDDFMSAWNTEPIAGYKHEDISCWASGPALTPRLSNIAAVVAGHDHFNDFATYLDDVQLIYGRKTGYAGNGPEPFFTKGARVFELNLLTSTFTTHIREENGNIVTQENFEYRNDPQSACADASMIPQTMHNMWNIVKIVLNLGGLVVGFLIIRAIIRNESRRRKDS